jgi:hypothetical protein
MSIDELIRKNEIITLVNKMMDICPELAIELVNSKSPFSGDFAELWGEIRLFSEKICKNAKAESAAEKAAEKAAAAAEAAAEK